MKQTMLENQSRHQEPRTSNSTWKQDGTTGGPFLMLMSMSEVEYLSFLVYYYIVVDKEREVFLWKGKYGKFE